MGGIPWTWIIVGAFAAYLSYTMYTLYTIFSPPQCVPPGSSACVQSYLTKKPNMVLEVMVSTKKNPMGEMTSVWKHKDFSLMDTVQQEVNVSVPSSTRRNGTLYVHAFLYPAGQSAKSSSLLAHTSTLLTTYTLPQAVFVNLLGEEGANKSSQPVANKPHTHWRSRLTISVMSDPVVLDRRAIPGEIYRFLRITQDGKYYYPILFLDELSFRIKDLQPVNSSSHTMPLSITYTPISVGKLRLWTSFLQSFQMLHSLGFTEKDTDEIKGIFADTNFYFLLLTFAVAAFHLLFDFLAFKNDIQYWKQRQTMVGLSSRGVSWRCIQTIIIFLYLLDENTSLLVTIPAGISTLIEVWKVTKVYKMTLERVGRLSFRVKFGEATAKEKETEEFDSQAMRYLSFVLYPLVVGGAVYSLIYVPHKSWYSWCLKSLVNGVYAFGFLFMLPQLFLNYKLKSVAHLPWRAFMYKAFNTFIDDVFAFIITMPTAHRLACFRDDLVFLVYLYQRWLYPVDKSRVNEFGMSFEEEQSKGEKALKDKKEQ
ncbi:lipid scramblase CLPTM1L-like [Babylonia areolata]|uniref:lipid scramblase CLPTM1L-like n=1 Tax=Babylonia areolata TaxID=304850 RepID=UPI003FD1181F